MLTDLFVSRVRVEVIALFLRSPGLRMHIREIGRQVGTEINAVRRELDNLTRIKFLKKEPSGNRIYYRARPDFVLYDELLGMVVKETGVGKKIIEQRKELGKIDFAMIAKDFAKGRVSSPSDVDLLVIGKLNLARLEGIIRAEEKLLGREINYTVLTTEEFDFRRRRKDPFLASVLQQPRIVLLGDEKRYARF